MMALYRVRAVFTMNSGVPEDRAVWSWGVDGAEPDAAVLRDAFIARLTAGISGFSGGMAGQLASQTRLQQIEVYAATGGPAVSLADGQGVTVGGTPIAPQVGISISSDVNDGGIVKPRGRIIFGPLSTQVSGARPSDLRMTGFLGWVVAWHADLVGLGLTPVVLNSEGTVGMPIVGYSHGNAFATMRTRKWESTKRTSVLV